MLVITLKRNKRYKDSFIVLLYNLGKRKPVRKLGKFYYNFLLNKFILSIDFFFLIYFIKMVFILLCIFLNKYISMFLN